MGVFVQDVWWMLFYWEKGASVFGLKGVTWNKNKVLRTEDLVIGTKWQYADMNKHEEKHGAETVKLGVFVIRSIKGL